ncbi:Transcriptional regulator [Orbilia oligospora]|uniref:Transcriptional regulator n=1 Tax=Orbilia oligospora TaxID=2813651 RepID=A0A7C8U8U7_ORBOL|nr:Transcriptional regulator [Orbilia oligospora]
MPPQAGKGKGKSRGGGSSSTSNRGRSRSRNTTPASMNDHSSSVSEQQLAADRREDAEPATYANVFQQFLVSADSYTSSAQPSQFVPAISSLDQLLKDLTDLREQADKRKSTVDRKIVKIELKLEKITKEEEEKNEGVKSEKEDKKKKKDRAMSSEGNNHRPHALGAHSTTSQNPSSAHIKEEADEGRATNTKKRKASASLEVDEMDEQPAKSPKREAAEDDQPGSEDDEQPPPMATLLIAEELSNDPADYEIGTVYPDTTVDEKRKIFSVAQYPMIDISDLIPGDPPDEDFSRAKPNSQIAMNTFASYIEPYFRLYTEEDLAFLRERGDRIGPYLIPALGRPYKDVWSEEDGTPYEPTSTGQEHVALGKPDDLRDEILAKNTISLGPLLSRVMSGLVVEDIDEPTVASGVGPTNGATSGLDVIMENAESTSGINGMTNGAGGDEPRGATLRPVAATSLNLPEGIVSSKDWKISVNRPEFSSLEERIRQEMIYMGMVGPSDTFHFADKQDDEVSARLRELQAELRTVSIRNGARKTRLAELLGEQLAYQEYATILDDLDKQVDQAYLKRTRGMKAKKKKPFAHHNANAAQTARPGIGDMAKTLMERRRKWKDTVGPVFDKDVTRIPDKTIFDEDIMRGLEAKEATEFDMAGWVDNWFTKRREQMDNLDDAASDSGAVVDPDETIEEIHFDSDFDSDATIPDPNFLDGYGSESDEDELGLPGQLDQMLKRGVFSARRPR